ncbi:MAG: cytochrome P450 [Stigonema ocellatum SAG 48.90 = DSM 106950]|nr:cytochrome P450 [Stigonema ocellatum SAG 48.90 = DSM 106950]
MSSSVTNTNASSKVKVPGPSLLGSISTLTRMWNDPIHFFDKLHNKYGDVVGLNIGFNKIFVINNAHYIKYILQENINNYKKLERLEMQTKLLFGEGWTNKINRQIIRRFFDPQHYASMDTAIADTTQKMLERWQTFANNHQPFDVAEEMMDLSLSFTAKSLIGHDFNTGQDNVAIAMKAIIDHFNARAVSNFNLPESFPTPANRRYLAAVRTVQTAVDQIIEERQHDGKDRADLLSVLQSWRDEETGIGLSPKLVRERLLWILLPAFEPIGRVLSWIWYQLSLNPNIELQMQAELVKVLGGRKPTFDDLPNLNYTKMVVQETLRLYPPFWVLGREAIEDDKVGGFYIPAKSTLLFNIYGVHHNPNYWDNPESFDPERFMPERSRNRPGCAHIPFSIGPRACLGYNLSIMQIQLVLAMVAQACRLQLMPGHAVEPAAMFSLLPRNGIQMTASVRT